MREVVTEWAGFGRSPKLSIMYFDNDNVPATLDAQQQAVADLWEDMSGVIDTEVSWSVRREARVMDPATGQVTGVDAGTATLTGTGAGAGQVLPDASQALIRWITGVYVDGRAVRGRQFVPGLTVQTIADGNLAAATQTTMQGAINTFLAAAVGFGVWHRPKGGTGGSHILAVGGSVWSEVAVLRGRRG